MTAGKPEFLITFKVFFLCVIIRKNRRAIKKKKDLKKSICHTVASSKDFTINPPQLKQKAPNSNSMYPGILYKDLIVIF
jgi:hypothetical protein